MFQKQGFSGASPEDSALALARIDGALSDFQYHLQHFENDLKGLEELKKELFKDAAPWRDLLAHKLLPHLLNRSCLLVVMAGGTSSGKSTLFNLLLQENVSLVKSTSAVTKVPVLAVNPDRLEAAESNYLLPDFKSQPNSLNAQTEGERCPPGTVFTAASERLPRSLALLDTPDYDSVEKVNWETAEKVRAAGDVVLAVITPIKYKDDETIEFFKTARASGRIVIPLMNKVESDQDPEITRQQLRQFINAAELSDPPCFLVPKDYALEEIPEYTIRDVDGKLSLLDYLSRLDIAQTKMKVYRHSLEKFLATSKNFLDESDLIKESITAFLEQSRSAAQEKASRLTPALVPSFVGRFRLQAQENRNSLFVKLAALRDFFSMPLNHMKSLVFRDEVSFRSHRQLMKAEEEALEKCSGDIRKQMLLLSEKYRQWLRRECQKQTLFKLFHSRADQLTPEMPAASLSDELFASSLFSQGAMEEQLKDISEEHSKVGMILWLIDRTFIVTFWLVPIGIIVFGILKALYFLLPMLVVDWLLLFLRRFCEKFLQGEMKERLEDSFKSEKEVFADELYHHIAEPLLGIVEKAAAQFETGNYEKLRSCHQECQKNLQNF
ncbi:MAG: hypothetical protein GX130_09895 [Candidatus Hydrogenedens sp.]|jgi:hypothetical protein|nr:hypothetical protein [Candidatus Hydrogenedens sp.]